MLPPQKNVDISNKCDIPSQGTFLYIFKKKDILFTLFTKNIYILLVCCKIDLSKCYLDLF